MLPTQRRGRKSFDICEMTARNGAVQTSGFAVPGSCSPSVSVIAFHRMYLIGTANIEAEPGTLRRRRTRTEKRELGSVNGRLRSSVNAQMR